MPTLGPQPPITNEWVGTEKPDTGRPKSSFAQYMQALDRLVRNYTAGEQTLTNAANDAAAAAAGVKIGQLYRTGNAVQIRLT